MTCLVVSRLCVGPCHPLDPDQCQWSSVPVVEMVCCQRMSNNYPEPCVSSMCSMLQSLEKGDRYFWFFDFAYVKGSLIPFVSLVMPMEVLLFSLCSPLYSPLLPIAQFYWAYSLFLISSLLWNHFLNPKVLILQCVIEQPSQLLCGNNNHQA